MILSKTNFLVFRDCRKNAWLKIHKPKIYYSFPLSNFELGLIDTGNDIDILARRLFPDGKLLSGRDKADVDLTKELVEKKTAIIYQPVFQTNKFLTASDILVWNEIENSYDLYEVKASTADNENDGAGRKTRDYFIDLAFQKNVLDEVLPKISGGKIKLGHTYLVRLNKKYVRQGELNIHSLFLVEDATDQVNKIVASVAEDMLVAHEYLSHRKEPAGHCDCVVKGRGSHCTTASYSLADIPKYSVHDIARIGNSRKKLAELVDARIFDIQQVPPQSEFELSDIQRRQVDTAQSGRSHVDVDGVREFLSQILYPIAFLDYETYPSALPRFDGYRPYQQIPFQYSLHIVEKEGSKPTHHEFLYLKSDCPDQNFASSLINDLPLSGTIVVWNQKFEKGINNQLAERLPKYKNNFININDRVIDLMIPFSGKSAVYDHPDFRGSASIKYVLPAMVPELTYKDLEIREGGTASDTWNKIANEKCSIEEEARARRALLDYCCLDTMAMLRVWQALVNAVKNQ